MKQYLLSIYQPEGGVQPAPEALQKIMRNVYAVRDEMKSAGAWVFSGGLHAPSTATVLRPQDGEVRRLGKRSRPWKIIRTTAMTF